MHEKILRDFFIVWSGLAMQGAPTWTKNIVVYGKVYDTQIPLVGRKDMDVRTVWYHIPYDTDEHSQG